MAQAKSRGSTGKGRPGTRSGGKAMGRASARPGQRAATRAKSNRVAESGLRSRVKGHVSARGKRAQAKRDSR